MDPIILKYKRPSKPTLLNLGCGRQVHSEWVNIDLEATSPEVIEHDVTQGIPFDEGTFEAVYHSHILEHLKPVDGKALLDECFRVLKPGGVLRIVVPDLERIARLYLRTHDEAWSGEEGGETNYRWMKLELLDQMVRENSGGRMGQYMASEEIKNSNFVHSRVGDEFSVCRSNKTAELTLQSWRTRFRQTNRKWREKTARFCVRTLLGKKALSAYDEGMFRSCGEIHRWMYDRYSLKTACIESGFSEFRVCQADESQIDDFSNFELDTMKGQVRKPDSLFIECEKPRPSVSLKRAA